MQNKPFTSERNPWGALSPSERGERAAISELSAAARHLSLRAAQSWARYFCGMWAITVCGTDYETVDRPGQPGYDAIPPGNTGGAGMRDIGISSHAERGAGMTVALYPG